MRIKEAKIEEQLADAQKYCDLYKQKLQEVEHKERNVQAKLKDIEESNRSNRYGRSRSPIGGAKPPKIFQSDLQPFEQRTPDQSFNDPNQSLFATNPQARETFSSIPQGLDVSNHLLETQRRPIDKKTEDKRSLMNETSLTIDYAAQRRELLQEKDNLQREKDRFKLEKSTFNELVSKAEIESKLLKEKQQEVEALKKQLTTRSPDIMVNSRQLSTSDFVFRCGLMLIIVIVGGWFASQFRSQRGRYPGEVRAN